MLIRRPPSALFLLFRSHMLTAFRQWISESRPSPEEIASEIEATISALRQIADTA